MIESSIEKSIENAAVQPETAVTKFWNTLEESTAVETPDSMNQEKAISTFWNRVVGDDIALDDGAGEVERYKNCPRENGEWESERGDSKWKPDADFVPQKANPENKEWREILDKYDIDGITFKDGEPDFSDISKGDVEIDGFTDNRTDNFDKADIALAKERGCTPEEVSKWRKENGYTWHECKDMKTMQKAPSEVHNNITHSGGIAEAKKGMGE
jgi:hypothetical protein